MGYIVWGMLNVKRVLKNATSVMLNTVQVMRSVERATFNVAQVSYVELNKFR